MKSISSFPTMLSTMLKALCHVLEGNNEFFVCLCMLPIWACQKIAPYLRGLFYIFNSFSKLQNFRLVQIPGIFSRKLGKMAKLENIVGKGGYPYFHPCPTMFLKDFFLCWSLTLYSLNTHFETSTTDSF